MPASGVIERSDEQFVLSGVQYDFLFPQRGGALAFGSSSPFAPKTTSGERTYQDYDPLSAVAFTDLSAGMGQDRATDVTRYSTAYNVDARGGRIILGPESHLSGSVGTLATEDAANLSDWVNPLTGTAGGTAVTIQLTQYERIKAAYFFAATGQTTLDRIWLPIGATFDIGTVTAKLYRPADVTPDGAPSVLMATTTINAADLRPEMRWVPAIFAATAVDAGGMYWIALEVPADTPGTLTWWARLTDASTANGRYYNGAAWVVSTELETARLASWAHDPNLAPAGPLSYTLGAGKDAVTRLWGWHGRRLYYLNSASLPIVANYRNGAALEPKDLGAESLPHGALWWQGTADMAPWLYMALGETTDILRYDGNVGAEGAATVNVTAMAYTGLAVTLTAANTFNVGDRITVTGVNAGFTVTNVDGSWIVKTGTTGDVVVFDVLLQPVGTTPQTITVGTISTASWDSISGKKARALCISDNMLLRAYDTNMVSGTLSGTFSETGTGTVGGKDYPIRRLVAWNGKIWAGKDDGLYQLTPETGYPTSGAITVERVLDFGPQTDTGNFTLMTVHQGDLIFNIGYGLLRLTSGLVLTPMTPDLGLNTPTHSRGLLKDAYSTIGALYVVVEGALTGPSQLLSYSDGHWHAIAGSARAGDPVRSVWVEGGLYSDAPRIWWSHGLQVAYNLVPTNTQKRWLWSGMDYATSGYIILPWVDGNILTIDKDWISVEVAAHDVGAGTNPHVEIWWRPDDVTAWVQLGADVTTNGLTTLTFPAASWGTKVQLQVRLYEGSYGGVITTPHVEAIVLKYLERPPDARTFTRTYEMATREYWRNGTRTNLTLRQQVDQLSALRNAKEPLTWYPWFGGEYQVHITRYSGSELDEERRRGTDIGSVIVVVELVVI